MSEHSSRKVTRARTEYVAREGLQRDVTAFIYQYVQFRKSAVESLSAAQKRSSFDSVKALQRTAHWDLYRDGDNNTIGKGPKFAFIAAMRRRQWIIVGEQKML